MNAVAGSNLPGSTCGWLTGVIVLIVERLGQRVVWTSALTTSSGDLRAVEAREHLARRLARAETRDVRLALQSRVRLLDLGLHFGGRNLDGELHHDGRDACDLDLHGTGDGSYPRTRMQELGRPARPGK